MVKGDWSKLFEVIILRESPEDNLIICYYDFGELLFFKKTYRYTSPNRWISPVDPLVIARDVSGWEFELEPAND